LPAINGELLERDRFAARDLGHNFAAVDALELFFAAHLNTQRMADSTMTTTTGEMIATRQQSAQRKQRLFGKAQLMQAGRALICGSSKDRRDEYDQSARQAFAGLPHDQQRRAASARSTLS
jgi:hypothetical protein